MYREGSYFVMINDEFRLLRNTFVGNMYNFMTYIVGGFHSIRMNIGLLSMKT